MKTVLYITYHFPPNNSSNSVRNFQVVNQLANKFRVFVLTIKPKAVVEDDRLLKRLNNNVTLLYTDIGVLHKAYYKNSKDLSGKNNNTNINLKKRTIKKIKEIGFRFKEKVLIPDPVIDWYSVAMGYITSLMSEIKPDYILSSATPYTSHLIGYKLSKKHKIPLILYYGDPWVYEQSRKRGFIRFPLEKFIESKILNHSRKVYAVTETTRNLYIQKFDLENQKVDVIQSGFDPNDFDYADKVENPKMTLIYGGTLNPIHRNPLPFFDALSMLDESIKKNIIFKLYCNDIEKYSNLAREKGITNSVEFKPIVPYKFFINELERSDLLILFGNSSSLQVPGKVFDYIGSLTRIFLINNTKDYSGDPTYKILRSYEGNFYAQNNSEEISRVLEDIYIKWKNEELEKINHDNVKKFTWDHSVQGLIKYIESN